ncbi:MAG: CHAT domain-containing protein [Myxococcota bacterium]
MSTEKIRILFLGASPMDRAPMDLAQEVFGIRQELERSHFELTYEPAVRASDISKYLSDYQPDIVHISVHGERGSDGVPRLVFMDQEGRSAPVNSEPLVKIFAAKRGRIRCVVICACHGAELARALARHFDCAIGVAAPLSDSGARQFSEQFYQELVRGHSVAHAYEVATEELELIQAAHSEPFQLYQRSPGAAEAVRFSSPVARPPSAWSRPLRWLRGLAVVTGVLAGLGLTAVRGWIPPLEPLFESPSKRTEPPGPSQPEAHRPYLIQSDDRWYIANLVEPAAFMTEPGLVFAALQPIDGTDDHRPIAVLRALGHARADGNTLEVTVQCQVRGSELSSALPVEYLSRSSRTRVGHCLAEVIAHSPPDSDDEWVTLNVGRDDGVLPGDEYVLRGPHRGAYSRSATEFDGAGHTRCRVPADWDAIQPQTSRCAVLWRSDRLLDSRPYISAHATGSER